jgi:hypothetical protein
VTEPTEPAEAAATARMDQVLALVRDAAEGLIDADRPPGTPVIDPFMYGLGLDILDVYREESPEELVEIAAGATLLLADSMAEVERLKTDLELADGDLDDYRRAGDTVAATRQMANEANAALRAQILGALGEEDDGRTPLPDQLARLIRRYRRVVAEVNAVHQQYRTPWTDEFDVCTGCTVGMELVPYDQCRTRKAIKEATES